MNQTMNKTMKTVAIDRFGGLNEMKIRELPVPELDANEILVRVEAAGVGVWDPFEREGGFAKEFNMSPKFPIILGSDGAGTVEAVGERVSHFKKGDRVYGVSFMSPKGGFYADYVVMKETNAARIPGKLSATQAGAMAVDVLTLTRALKPRFISSRMNRFSSSARVVELVTWRFNSPNEWAHAYSRSRPAKMVLPSRND